METWVAQEGQRYGPYSQEQLQEMLATGQVAPNAQIWLPETKQWVNAQELPGYQRARAGAAPTGWDAASAHQAAAAPGYPAPAYQPPTLPPEQRTNTLAIGALAVGVASLLSLVLVLAIVLAPVPALLGALAIILGFLARSQVKKTGEKGGGLAIAGIVTGALAVVLLAAIIVWTVAWLGRVGQELGQELGPQVNRACAAAVRTDLQNAATTQEVVLLDQQSYTQSVLDLTSNGWQSTAQVMNCASAPLTIAHADDEDYCMEMGGGGQTFAITKQGLREGSC